MHVTTTHTWYMWLSVVASTHSPIWGAKILSFVMPSVFLENSSKLSVASAEPWIMIWNVAKEAQILLSLIMKFNSAKPGYCLKWEGTLARVGGTCPQATYQVTVWTLPLHNHRSKGYPHYNRVHTTPWGVCCCVYPPPTQFTLIIVQRAFTAPWVFRITPI